MMVLPFSCALLGLTFILTVLCSVGLPAAKISPSIVAEETLWRPGEADVFVYRSPLLTYTPRGRLLAVCEARKYSADDASPKFVAIRRSADGLVSQVIFKVFKPVVSKATFLVVNGKEKYLGVAGDSWEPTALVVDDGYGALDGLNLGNVIVDDERGLILVMYSVCYHHKGCGVASVMLIRSVDDGVTWSRPVNVSEQIGTMTFSPGPGFGFQKKLMPNKGRLVSCGHNGNGGPLWGLHCLLSDDHGATWKWGGWIKSEGSFVPTECQAVELPDGSVMVNIRNNAQYQCDCRLVARSYDGAQTFSPKDISVDRALVEPGCAAGLLYHRGVLFFSNPKSTTERVDLTLRWSYDNGTTWPGQLTIWDKSSGHSTITAHYGTSPYIFLLIEKGFISYTESVVFVRVSLYD